MTPGKTNVVLANSNVGEETSTTGSGESTKIIIPGEIIHQNIDENTIPNKNAGENDNGTGDTLDEKSTVDSVVAFKNQKSVELKMEPLEEGELLGSLVTMNSPAVRTSARVIQKMKMDSIRPTTPPMTEKKDTGKEESHRGSQKTPSQPRASKTIWTNVERNLFFEALNEYGREFESIAQYINVKQKRKNTTDPTYKTKEHIRHLYYQTYHKMAKYLRFSDDIKKHVQELYILINYGEMRKKLSCVNQKGLLKLRELVYKGWVSIRVKGKNYRIKTPSCKALRKINQVEEWQEDIKLPLKVDVILRPGNNESWCKVQSLAQNPRIKTTLPLQKRLISLFKTLQIKWRSREAKLIDQASMMIQNLNQKPGTSGIPPSIPSTSSSTASNPSRPSSSESTSPELSINSSPPLSSPTQFQYSEPVFYIAPHNDAVIHRPMVNLTEFLSSYSICLNSYEERIGATIRGETLCAERVSFKEMVRANTKRQRHDSGSEKKSPDMKRSRAESDPGKSACDQNGVKKQARDISKLSDDLSTTDEEKYDVDFMGGGADSAFEIDGISHIVDSTSADEYEREDLHKIDFKAEPLDEGCSSDGKKEPEADQEPTMIVPDCIKQNLVKRRRGDGRNTLGAGKRRDNIRKDAFRPLINEEVIKEIRKGWTVDSVGDLTIGDLYIMFGQDSKILLEYKWDDTIPEVEVKSERVRCSETTGRAGYSEDNIAHSMTNEQEFHGDGEEVAKPRNPLTNKLRQLLLLANMTEKTKRKATCACGHYCDRGVNKVKQKDEMLPRSFVSNKIYPSSHSDSGLFRQPVLPIRAGLSPLEAYRLNMNNSRSKQNRWSRSRNNRPSKLVVQRLLPLQPGMTQTYGVVTTTDGKYSSSTSTDTPPSRPPLDDKSNEDDRSRPKSMLTSENLSRINQLSNYKMNNNNREGVLNVNKSPDMSRLLEFEHARVNEDDDSDDNDTGSGCLNDESVESEEDESSDNSDAGDSIHRRMSEDPGIQSLMDISLPSPLPIHNSSEESDYAYSNGTPPMSPMGILQDAPSDPRWYEENINDFSLSSFLGHLDATCEANGKSSRSPNRAGDSSSLSTISETSIDYITKFEELAESMKNDVTELLMP